MPFSERRLDFIPERDGFSFPNAFTWTPLDLDFLSRWFRPVSLPVAAALPASGAALTGGWRGLAAGALVGVGLAQVGLGAGLVRGAARRWRSFGLCGGMACVAAQRWPHRGGLPTAELQPDPMRMMLWRQQVRTLAAAGGTFVRYWLRTRSGRTDVGEDLLREWEEIRSRIDAGRPVVIGLVGDAPDPFAMHQVLAYGYAGTEDRGTLLVYDPNSPGKERTIAFTVAGRYARLTTDLPTGPAPSGYHVSTRPGRLDMFFVVEA